jgi:hypothetical protein
VFKRGKTWSFTVYLGRDAATGKKRYQQRGGFPTRRACEDALRLVVDRCASATTPMLARRSSASSRIVGSMR